MNYELRRISVEDQQLVIDHFERHAEESGRLGQQIFMPFSSAPQYRTAERMHRQASGWKRQVGESGWLAEWGVLHQSVFVAHVSLKGGEIDAQQHRAVLSLGVEQAHQRQGLAATLIGAALDFARSNELSWIDLRVFGNNDRALALYKKFGFLETGQIHDCFRVGEMSITDISMSLKLA